MQAVETPRPEFEYISPDRARRLLEAMAPNRKLKSERVTQLTRAMLRGEFDPYNGEAIKIDDDARLVDGQHRLQAIIDSGVSQNLLVVRGVRPTAMYTIDAGAARSLVDALNIRGEKNASYLATAIKGAHAYVNGYFGRLSHPKASAPTVVESLEILDTFPSTRDAALASGRFTARAPEYGKYLTPSAYGPLWWVFSHYDESEANDFFDRLTLGDNLSQDNPIWVLRRAITNLRSTAGSGFATHLDYTMAITVKAWNAWMTSTPIKTLKWRPSGSKSPEAFPKIFGEEVISASVAKEQHTAQI